MSRRLQFLLALAPQLAILLFMIVRAETTLEDGIAVELAVEPFDPIDPLSGRHLVVPLAIERLDDALLETSREWLAPGQTLFVRLRPHPAPAVALAVGTEEPPAGVLFLRGTLRSLDDRPGTITVDYGLDRFFIPLDATDPTLFRDADGRRPEVRLLVHVDAQGTGVTADLLVDGEPFADWNRRVAPR